MSVTFVQWRKELQKQQLKDEEERQKELKKKQEEREELQRETELKRREKLKHKYQGPAYYLPNASQSGGRENASVSFKS